MPCHISYRDVAFAGAATSVTIVITTDIASHCYARASAEAPRIHKKPVFRRGTWLSDDVRFCFTVFEDIEQNEAGDTLTHTFSVPGWAPCNTWHVYFWGKVAGVACVSTSPVFNYHNTYIPPVYIEAGWPPSYGTLSVGNGWAFLLSAKPCTGSGVMTRLVYQPKTIHVSNTGDVGLFRLVSGTSYQCLSYIRVPMKRRQAYTMGINWPCETGDVLGLASQYVGFAGNTGAYGSTRRSSTPTGTLYVGQIINFYSPRYESLVANFTDGHS
ncbi:hypothetical protein ES705_27898 [subsurface metagenome]